MSILAAYDRPKQWRAIGTCLAAAKRAAGSPNRFILSDHYYRYFRCMFKEFGVLDETYSVKQEDFGRLLSNNSAIKNEADRQFAMNLSSCTHFDCIARNCNITINKELSAGV